MILLKKRAHLVLKAPLAVMRFLRLDVPQHKSGLQPSIIARIRPWGFTPGCYLIAPLALASLAVLTALAGCKSSSNTGTMTLDQAVKEGRISEVHIYSPRPTTPPPPFKLFHTTDNSITLVTAANATDDQIAAILWQLHDAAHNHTFAALHISQKFVDARDPMVWFHIYRGAKCASEKYTTGTLPCGPSYHAAGDYTLGGFSNKDRDDAVLLHAGDKQTELWNPDAP